MPEEARPMVSWDSLKETFEGADVLLGNGFSIAVDGRFDYRSLFEDFLANLGDDAERDLFRSLESHNFEFLLESLGRASWINEKFGLPTEPLDQAAETLRDGLIAAVGRVHPRFDELDGEVLERLCEQLGPFGNIYTTNYDALLYHIIMIAKDRWEADRSVHPYNDYFWERRGDGYLEFRNFQLYTHYRHIYYLHGALFLFGRPEADVKLRRGDAWTELVDLIGQAIERGERPLFVSEGSAEEKRSAIHRSEYLSFALDKLQKARRPIVVFGFGFTEPDRHIVRALGKRHRQVAVAVYEGMSDAEKADFRRRITASLPRSKVSFFSSADLFQPPPEAGPVDEAAGGS